MSELTRVSVTRVDRDLPLPRYATDGATGLDLYCRSEITVAPGAMARVPANVIVAVPAGHVLLVALRSGTPGRTGLISPHGLGIVDQDYSGPEDEIKILVFNPGAEAVTVRRGDRIAQLLLLPVAHIEWEEQDSTGEISRGGFGSTG